MVLTPTYHLFRMMKGHQDGERVDLSYDADSYEADGEKIPSVSVSASVKNGVLTVTAANTRLDSDKELKIELDADYSEVSGEVLTASDMCDFNDFDEPDKVSPKPHEAKLDGRTLTVSLPRMSVIALTLK